MIRITTGSAKNKKLKIPSSNLVKPVQEVVKLAIFAIITPEKITDSSCLDLYSGTGNLGIEALSRGAMQCDFVDQGKLITNVIKENIKDCGFSSNSEVFTEDATKYVANTSKKYDIIFVDPPYNDTKHKFLLKNLDEILKVDGYIAFTHGEELDIENQIENTNLALLTQRRYGKTFLSIINHP